jgi:hypothetical protein
MNSVPPTTNSQAVSRGWNGKLTSSPHDAEVPAPSGRRPPKQTIRRAWSRLSWGFSPRPCTSTLNTKTVRGTHDRGDELLTYIAGAPEKRSLWQRFKRWPLIARIGTFGCGGFLTLFILAAVGGARLAVVDSEGTEERQQAAEERRGEREAEKEHQAGEDAEAERQAEGEATGIPHY